MKQHTIWNPVTKSLKLRAILIPLWNTLPTHISPGYRNHWLLTRWDYPISKKKITHSCFSCAVFQSEFGLNINMGHSQGGENLTQHGHGLF